MKQLLLLLLIVMSSVSIAVAQNGNDVPLVVTRYEDDAIYIVEGNTLVPICETGEARAEKYTAATDVFRISPDGLHVVFQTWANGEPDRDAMPSLTEPFMTNSWICDLTTGEATRLPRETDVFQTLPVFSPDGDQIAWAQTTDADAPVTVQIYDFDSDETDPRFSFEPAMLSQSMPYLDWARPGIAVSGLMETDSGHPMVTLLATYGTNQTFTYPEPLNGTVHAIWVLYERQPRLWLRGVDASRVTLISEDFETVETIPAVFNIQMQQQSGNRFFLYEPRLPYFLAQDPDANRHLAAGLTTYSPDGELLASVLPDNYPYGGDLYVSNPRTDDDAILIGEAAGPDEPGVQAIGWGAPERVVAEVTVRLTEYTSDKGWLTQVPANWERDNDTFTRDQNTTFVIGGGSGFSVEEVVADAIGTPLEPSGTITNTGSGDWTLYEYDYRKPDTDTVWKIHMGVMQFSNEVYTIILQAPQSEAAALYDLVFLPAVNDFRFAEVVEPQFPPNGISVGEETTVIGTVTGTIDDCAFDGNCALVLDTEYGVVNAIWAEGMMQCQGQYDDEIAVWDTVEVFGIVRDGSSLSICPSADYYIQHTSARSAMMVLPVAAQAQPETSFTYDGVSLVYDTFDAFLAAIDTIDTQTEADAFMQTLTDAERVPFAVGERVAFLYQNPHAEQVDWRGDFSGWEALEQYAGQRIGETDLWVMTATFPADARLDYKIVMDDSQWIIDPANPLVQVGGMGPNSELRMPDYTPSAWVDPLPDIPRGNLSATTPLDSQNLGYAVNYRVYTPADYGQIEDLPVIYVTDGHEYANSDMGSMVIVLDNLIAVEVITPVIVVFIDPRNPDMHTENRRQNELLENPDYAAFIAEELVPMIDADYDTSTDRTGRAILGTSYGGVHALYMAVTYPDLFGKIAAQSPAVWAMQQSDLYLNHEPITGTQYFISNGSREWDSRHIDMVVDVLAEQGIDHLFIEVNEGHSWGNWRALLDDMLVYFFGA